MKKQYFKNFRKEGLPGGPNELIINSEGFILSENGQWEFPGLPTVIPSSDITMEDVPYPVLGISDTGDTQMMYPEEDYQFDGDMVYELPMAQKGYNVKPRKGSILLEGETEPSTHLMRREYIPNTGWVAFPSLFQNEDGTWVDMSKEEDWMNIYDEANRRGEVYNFGENKRKAIKFADKGSWKKDLGIKKQGGGDISIPDLTKPNWLDTLPKQYPDGGKLTEAIYKYAKQFKPGSVDDSEQMETLSRPIINEFSDVNKTWLKDVMWGTPLKEPTLTGFEEEGRNFINKKEERLYNQTHDSETGLLIDIDKETRLYNEGMFPMSYPNYKPKFIAKQKGDVSVETEGDVEGPNEDKLQYAEGGDLPPMEVNIGLPKYGKKRVLNLKDYTKQNTTSNRFPVVQNPFSRENKINLHLPENHGEEHRRLEVNPYFGGINVEPDFNVYYGGVDADLNLLNKNNNILDLRGGLNTDLVTYPGGSEFTSVNPSIGLSFTRKFAEGGWLNNLPKAQPGGTREPIYVDPNDLLGMQRYNAYNDSLNLYKAYRMQDELMGPGSRVVRSKVIPGEWSIRELLDNRKKKYNSHLRGFFAKDWQSEEDMRRAIPIGDEQNSFDLIKYYKSLGFTDKDIMYHTSPDIVSDKIRPIGTYMDGSFNSPIYKKPVQPYAIRKTEPRTPYSPVQTNPNSTVQLPINNIPLQQIPTIGIGEPTFEGNNAYWKKQNNQLIYQNNDYSNNRNLPISNKPGDRFHQEPSWMVGDDRYYERDGEAYLVPQPKGGWKNKQILDPSSGKWKSKIVKKTNGDWLDELQDGGSAKLLNRSRKEIIKQRELEENLRKEGFNEDGVFTRVLPEYTVKSPEKKLYDEAFQDVLNKQKSFQNKWYPGDISEGVLDNMKQRANVIASDKVAKNILENNKVKDLKDYQKEYIANSNYSGKLRPGIFKEFTEGVQDLGRITQGKLPTTKALGILSPLEYPVNLVRGTVKGEGLDALKGKISSPWIDASKVDIGAVNDVGAYNTIYNIGLDPLNLTGIGLTGAADDVLKGISKGSKYFKTNKIVNTPKQLPNPSLGEPLGTVEDVANRSAIQYAGSEPYLFNPETNTWEILRNEINDKYRQGYTDIPQFNEQLKEIKATTEFGKRPLLNKADFVNPNQAEIDMLFNKHTTYKDYIPETNFKALQKEAEEMGIPMDNLLERALQKLAYKSNRDPLTSKPFYFNAENPRVGNRALLYSNPNYFKMFGKELNEIGPLGGKTTSEIPRYYQDQINRYTDMLEIATESQKISIQNKIVELYKKGLNQTIDKNAKPFTGKDAFQYIEPNKLGGQKKGWLNNLPKAQKGNTGKQSANESWGLTQESQLSDLTKGLLNNILHRQAFAESSFNPKVISGDKTSRVGALGMTQIMPETLNEYINKTGDKNINILDPKDAVKVQKWYMQDLLNADFIHKPNQSEKVRMVKALGSYNWGRGNMSKFLGKQKKKGVDIYSDELSWVNDLPVETRDYVNKIVLGTNEKFNQEYKQNSSKYKDYYQKGGWLDKL